MKEVSKTAFFCAGCRMADAATTHPIVGDYFAKKLMGESGLEYWKNFEAETNPIASNQARHYLVDTHLRRHLGRNPAVTIIHVGAGLDARPFRMYGGNWVEIDAPEILAYKEQLLPAASCRNPLQRIPTDFDLEPLADKLAAFTSHTDVVFVVEGVLMYLTQAQREEQLQTLRSLFPRHHYICELMSKLFYQKLAKPFNDKLKLHGASFIELQDEPAAMFHKCGYQLLDKASTIDTALHLGRQVSKRFFVNLMPQNLKDGYSVYHFAYGA